MRRLFVPLVTALVIAVLLAPGAGAVAAKFHRTAGGVTDAGALVVSFDERGVGNENIDYLLTADAEATFACINGGGNHPQAANKETTNATVAGSASLEPKNGRVQADVSAGPPSAGDFSCPGGQELVLASVSYTDIVLTDTTNGSATTVDDASRTFMEI